MQDKVIEDHKETLSRDSLCLRIIRICPRGDTAFILKNATIQQLTTSVDFSPSKDESTVVQRAEGRSGEVSDLETVQLH